MARAGGNRRMKNDVWADKAKHEGYPARSVYKLEEIVGKTGGITAGSLVLDLGAAPGSWTLFLVKKFQARVVACDLKPLDPQISRRKDVNFIAGDFLSDTVLQQIASFGTYDAVVSDAAPATSGDRLVDSARSYNLAQQSLFFAQKYLKENGLFITKIFSGGDEQALVQEAKPYFQSVKIMRPKAIRKESFEVYIVGQGFIRQSPSSREDELL
ncbi:RlmE family RNA methyltransferase [Entomospira entomophila]|uniref:Ribosomal RNA large subunit methyltransferase E n=1 Tax=Entomospira entomophila TaxID=2719988 RepID=A0A968GBK2_9SPIO|nr:RlmE family RNA methyltransferase [Entomospira entomophilus]NIZ40613.1 RlmE family RNA methyltransferase [Entomospira entomophilus]WDI34828.1 RlmE family RNA methyltransferase [Entomospira entomophilus]